ncbi:MAG TPA: hypothetical protein VMW08_10820 [Acidimicrobiales bacterium]|nr:hypothetical protein [Acidimicrobiales bacterium]
MKAWLTRAAPDVADLTLRRLRDLGSLLADETDETDDSDEAGVQRRSAG